MKLVSRSCGVTFSVTFVSTNSAVAENVFVIALGLCGVELVGGRDVSCGAGFRDGEDDGVTETARTLNDRSAAGAPAQDRNLPGRTGGDVHFG